MHEIRFRTPVSLHRAINLAAAQRGIASSALVSLAVYEYLRERGEIAPTQQGANQTEPKATLPFEWLEEDEPLNVGS